ncbi:hypothetical protein BDF22DRAFT_699095 [Syncephalis plumigaleata]|nr:hypothetical protein BDF22DRAFT_699095 [Syncephalis plumigaleata]
MPLLTAILPSINVLLLPLFNISSSLEAKMDEHLDDFTECLSIKEALGLFLFGHYHLGKSSIEFKLRWSHQVFEGVPKTVLDEPFVLKATKLFQINRVASNITIHQFMKAHAENGSKQGDKLPHSISRSSSHWTRHHFFVKINNNIYPCFVHLKLRQVLDGSDAKTALETLDTEHEKQKKTSASSDQQQPRLQDYCQWEIYQYGLSVCPSISMAATFKIFPSGHVEFLNILKEYKRPSEDEPSQQSKRSKTDHDS